MLSIRVLMRHPNADDGLVPSITEQFRRNETEFNSAARAHTIEHAMSRPSLVGDAGAGRTAPEIAKARDNLPSSEQSEDSDSDSDSSAETGDESTSPSVAVGSKRPPSGDEGSDREAAKKHFRGST